MIKTRFDDPEEWVTKTASYEICEMETMHLINTIRMFQRSPMAVLSVLLEAVDENTFTFSRRSKQKSAVDEITSMSEEELIEVAMTSPLICAMWDELTERGVNVENVINIEDEQQQRKESRRNER